jgi:hypothetical protein
MKFNGALKPTNDRAFCVHALVQKGSLLRLAAIAVAWVAFDRTYRSGERVAA